MPVTISQTCRLAERVASRPPTVAAHFGGLRRNGTTASARERNDGTREGDRIRRDWLSRPPRRPAFARVRIFDTSSRRGIRNAPKPFSPTLGSASSSIHADINDDRSVAAAVAAVEGVVNAVSLYVASGQETFHSVHVTGAARVARLAREARVRQLIHVSGIGSDAGSSSPYIRSRGEGEIVVREAFPAVVLIRPSVMFGRGDAFVTPVARMLRRLPIFPLFGRGQTQLQPAHVEDVAEAIARAIQTAQPRMYMSSADRASTPTERCSKCLHGIWAESQFCFPSRLVSGTRSPTRGDAAPAAHHAQSGRTHANR